MMIVKIDRLVTVVSTTHLEQFKKLFPQTFPCPTKVSFLMMMTKKTLMIIKTRRLQGGAPVQVPPGQGYPVEGGREG